MIEQYIIKSFVKDRELHEKWYPRIRHITVDQHLDRILKTIEAYYLEFPAHNYISEDQLNAYLDLSYPMLKDRDVYASIISNIYNIDISDSITDKKCKELVIKEYANKIAQSCIPIISGETKDSFLSDLSTLVHEAANESEKVLEDEENDSSPFDPDDLDDLLSTASGDGLRWRMDCLNSDLGCLPGGTLGHLFARPDAGKTSFLHSEVSNFCYQFLKRNKGERALWFNNEENKKRIKIRWWSAVTGLDKYEIAQNPKYADKLYSDYGGDLMGLVDRPLLRLDEVEHALMSYRPRIAVIDVGDKCVYRGMDKVGNGAEKLKGIYDNLREICKRCNRLWPIDIITTGQADAASEDKKWVGLTNMDGGKTGKPGAFDYAIGIGKISTEPDSRYIFCCKNKLGDQSERHVVGFDPRIARYV